MDVWYTRDALSCDEDIAELQCARRGDDRSQITGARWLAKKETWTNRERTAIIGVKRPTFDSLPAACGFTVIRQCWACWRVDALDGT